MLEKKWPDKATELVSNTSYFIAFVRERRERLLAFI